MDWGNIAEQHPEFTVPSGVAPEVGSLYPGNCYREFSQQPAGQNGDIRSGEREDFD